MARIPDDDDDEAAVAPEGPSLVGRLFRTGAAAPNVALGFIADQVSGWKKDFLGIFQSEIRRFLDRQDAGAELRKLIDGKRLEISVRLVDDHRAPAASEKPATKPKKAKKRR